MFKGKIKLKNKYNTKNVYCYGMPSAGDYVNLFLHTAKVNILKFIMVIAYSSKDCSFFMQKLRKTKEKHFLPTWRPLLLKAYLGGGGASQNHQYMKNHTQII